MFVTGKNPVMAGKHAQMKGFSRHLTGKFQVQSLWAEITKRKTLYIMGILTLFPQKLPFVAGKDPVVTRKHAKVTGLPLLRNKFKRKYVV